MVLLTSLPVASAGVSDEHAEDVRMLFDRGYGCSDAALLLESALGWEGCAADPGDAADLLGLPGCLRHLDTNCVESSTFGASMADGAWFGEAADDRAGYRIAFVGDVDGDGRDELAATAIYEATAGDDAGAAYVMGLGLAGAADLSRADLKVTGEAADDNLGESICGPGDVDGDGLHDVLVGAPQQDGSVGWTAGAFYLFGGTASATMGAAATVAQVYGDTSATYLGSACAGLGDADGDGFGEVLLGGEAYNNDYIGAAYVFQGPLSGSYTVADATLTLLGETADGQAGGAVSTADLDGDGMDDLVIAADREDTAASNAGAVYIVMGLSTGTLDLADADAIIRGDAASDHLGWDVDAGGDADGDGRPDLAVTAGASSAVASYAGALYMLSGDVVGETTASSAAVGYHYWEVADAYGTTAAWAGDLDADGHDDLVAGAYGRSVEEAQDGTMSILLGPVSGTTRMADAWRAVHGEAAADYFGMSVAAGGDIDGDGLLDIAASAPYDSFSHEWGGAVYVFLGAGL